MHACSTLTELIALRSNEELKGITFILGDNDERYVSYKELYYSALRLLGDFQKAGFKPGDEVIFQIDDNQSFVYSFWACILGGMIPVPVTTGTNDEHKLKLFKIWKVLNNPRVLATKEFLGKLEDFAQKRGLLEEIKAIRERARYTDNPTGAGDDGIVHEANPRDIAFIQFSSGSTGDPKGVIITHSNVLINLNSVIRWAHIDSRDSGLNWMPLTHDMGLIGTHIKDVIACINQYNIQTTLFIRHPSLWLQKASEHGVTLLYSPNFGYKHFLKFYNPGETKNWDLSKVRLIYNGAEPISIDLCDEFLEKLSAYGLKREAMHPVYGLAEGTIAVTFPRPGEEFRFHVLNRSSLKIGEPVEYTDREDKNSVAFMDVGYPIHDCRVRICDGENRELAENKTGYVQISGGNVTSGYYNNRSATESAITADGWLNTGDLGFMREGRLVITGRAKDVIFVAGQNYYSHDIERVAEGVEGIELGKIAAAGVFNDQLKCDELLLFVLSKQRPESFVPTANHLKRLISRELGIEVSEVIPVKNIPKTTSGKVQRYKLRESYLKGEFDLIKQELHALMKEEAGKRSVELPRSATEKELAGMWAEVLNVAPIGIHDDFFEFGGDSLKITQLVSRIRDRFGVCLEQAALFENPDIESLAKVIENSARSGDKKIEVLAGGSEPMPLSFSQQRLWFLDRLNGESPQYNLSTALAFKGRLSLEALDRSLNAVIKRHRILQMSFREENGKPVQVLNPKSGIHIGFEDLRGIQENKREKEASNLMREEACRPFDLEKAPLLRAKLLCTGENEHILVLSAHHLVFDGWSFGILLKELSAGYEVFLKGEEPRLPAPDIQYTDYAGWQRQRVQEGFINHQLAYWKDRLSGGLPVLELPLDKQRPAVQTYSGAKFTSSLPAELIQELKAYAGKEKATLFMVLLAAFNVLLYRYTGQSDIMVGSPVANRNRREIEELIGFFTNNLVLRTRFDPEIQFKELVQEVREVTLKAFANQDVPFEKLVEELHIQRDMSRNPLFQVLFSLQNTPLPHLEFSELNVSTLEIDGGHARFDISVDIREAGGGLAVDFEYNTDLFNKDTIVRMAGHFRQLLHAIARNPGSRLDAFEMLTPEEKKRLLYDWNNTRQEYGRFSGWIDLFEEQARKTPGNMAVICGGQSLTYRQLNERSNRLANYLLSQQVGPESTVGVYMERSVNMLVGLLGIHKAGAAYLPMDPIFPKDRLAYMLEDSEARTLLSEEELAKTLTGHKARVICLDTESEVISACSGGNPERKGCGNGLAYVIYTSGSTGKPKGVQIEQHALVNFLLSMEEKTGIWEKDALLAVTTLSFDIAGLELYLPLICGARVVIAEREDVMDGGRLAELLSLHGISILQATPATWRLLIEAGWKGVVVKALCGGEALPAELGRQLLDRCPVLFNVYGPTETTIWSTLARVEALSGRISIGKPIANTRVYVLDKAMNPVPIGVPGELFIGGVGLARGYLNLPGLTGEKFVPDPFSGKTGERLYRTGDLVKFAADGNLEFIGRMDNQVKIRGFRIELGEIEILLNRRPGIKESVVVPREIIPGEKSLVAYIVPAPGPEEDLRPESLRKSLRENLPDYMVPAAFVLLDSFPVTPNGKLDRKALPMPENLRPGLEIGDAHPSNPAEKAVMSVWQEVLKLERIGIHENFFDLGGHSLLLAQVRSKLAKHLDREVSILDLFKYPTIHTLSKFLGGEAELEAEAAKDRKRKVGNKSGAIAIIGLSGRFPGARNTDEFWENLCTGVESISRFTEEQVLEEGVSPEALKKPGYVKAWGALEDIERFDAPFFGYNPREAEVLDPQQRIFLEEAWKALENAGYDSERFNGSIGVYASVGMNTYARKLRDGDGDTGLAGDYQIMISNDKDFLATRIAYKLNLEGPGITVQTACSSSLVAVHLACQSLMNGECDMALAGGVSIRLPQKSGYLYQEGMILSPDGHCRAFDEAAKGTVGGNGAGVVILKPLEAAVADGDDIRAVIRGSAVNNDGALKIGYTAPRIDGQAGVIEEAQRKAEIAPETISYIEAHGTGTPLGDPIEIEALTRAFRKKTDKNGFCAIGSAKTNVGHLDAAAGVTGLIKAVLCLRNKKLPPSLHFKRPNPKIDFKNSPFYVNGELCEWRREAAPLRAGVSSFGIGGTNAHVVLEEAPDSVPRQEAALPVLLVFSAKSSRALEKLTWDFKEFLKKNRDLNLADAAYTLQLGRREHEYRRFLVCSSVEEAIAGLENRKEEAGKVSGGTESNPLPQAPASLEHPEDYALEEIGRRWLEGAKIDWSRLYEGQKRKRTALPAYPFEGQKYWVEKKNTVKIAGTPLKDERKKPVPEWFYTPVWKQSVENLEPDGGSYTAGKGTPEASEVLLVLTDGKGFAGKILHRLKARSTGTVVAFTGKGYRKLDDKNYVIDSGEQRDFEKLLSTMAAEGRTPSRIVNLLGITGPEDVLTAEDSLRCGEELFFSLLYLAQALGSRPQASPVEIKAITSNAQKLFGEKAFYPEKALHLGACRVIPREYPHVRCASIDIPLPEPESAEEEDILERLSAEVFTSSKAGIAVYRGPERWIQDFENIRLDRRDSPPIKLRKGGVYLITGGLGGLGLVTADYLAREAEARLVLLGRSDFPGMEEWDAWIASHGRRDAVSEKILKLRQCQTAGAEILLCRADVSDLRQLQEVRERIENTFGSVNGIIHAAGSPGGGMVQRRKREQAEQVLAPKVRGTLALYEAFKDCGLDFCIFCSSLNAITGGFGQIDYSAANAYLDAFAQKHDSGRGTRYVSIDWDRWPGTGMAVGLGQKPAGEDEEVHPLPGGVISQSAERTIYGMELCPEKDWVLSEHLVMGVPTLAGTTYLEMARAAFEDITGNNRAEISWVVFLHPLAVDFNEKRTVYTVMDKKDGAFEFRIASRRTGEPEERAHWLEHVRGRVAAGHEGEERVFSIAELRQKCSGRMIFEAGGKQRPAEEFIRFGARWKSLKNFSLGEQAGLAEVELAKEYVRDLEDHKLHPALLDVATGAVRLAGEGNYLPFSYERLNIREALPHRIYSHIRFKNGCRPFQEVITCDIDILGDRGNALAEIRNFSMRLTGESAAASIRGRRTGEEKQTEYASVGKLFEGLSENRPGVLKEGITQAEGQEALHRIFSGCWRPQVVVSTKDIYTAVEQAGYIDGPNIRETLEEAAVSRERHPRPELENEFVPAKNETEKKLTELWQQLLGIDSIGIHDEFFALGGDSLLLIQLHSKIKENFETEIAVVDLYKYNTVALLAKYLSSSGTAEEAPVFEEVNSRVNKQLEVMKQRRQQMQLRKGGINGGQS